MGGPDLPDEVALPRWAPSDLPGLQMWLDASELSPGPLMTWPDKTGHGHDARPVPGGTPYVVEETPGSLPVMQMEVERDYLTIDGDFSDFSAGMSLFFVVSPRVSYWFLDPPPYYTNLFEFGRIVGAHEDAVIVNRGGRGESELGFWVYWEDKHVDGFWADEAVGNFSWQLFEAELGAGGPGETTSGLLFRNGAIVGWGATILVPRILSRTLNLIGGSNFRGPDGSEDSGHFRGEIAEVIMYGQPLEAADRKKVEGYLSAKWHVP
jgi:hypothetical protein